MSVDDGTCKSRFKWFTPLPKWSMESVLEDLDAAVLLKTLSDNVHYDFVFAVAPVMCVNYLVISQPSRLVRTSTRGRVRSQVHVR